MIGPLDPGHAPTRRPAIETVLADITLLHVDAVVNAANAGLSGGGGVDGAIHRRAGAATLRAACRSLGGCDTGDAKATSGFALAATWIIHTVGPVWHGGAHGEAALLASCYRRSLEVADELGATSVAFPAISTGAYGFPPTLGARIAVRTLSAAHTATVERVVLAAYDAVTFDRYRALLDAGGADPGGGRQAGRDEGAGRTGAAAMPRREEGR